MTRHHKRKQRTEVRALGIRTAGSQVEALDAEDQTLHGVYWFDLRTRRPFAARAKRVIDVIGALLLIVLLTPLLLALAAIIVLTSRGPAVFVQKRIGFRCNEFEMYKFRSMRLDADAERHRMHGASKQFFKVENDPRITPIGKFLRRYSLDELPQLFNVLEGSMSLVGPRPLLLSDLQKFPLRGQMRRFSVKPGMTGLWQVSGRSSTSDQERMRLDREYVNRWSLLLDFKILLRTVRVVLSGHGAT